MTSNETIVVESNNGDDDDDDKLHPSMFPHTRDGILSQYKTERHWIGLKEGEPPEEEAASVKALIVQLCEHFYHNGWSSGTAGGVSIRVGGPDENRPYRVFVAPSGMQKENMIGDDVFELDMDSKVVEPPKTPNLRLSACTELWYLVYKHRPSTKCVIHTHSINSQMATLAFDPSEKLKSIKITHLEKLKGVNLAYDDVLEVPILDNRPSEDLLSDQFEVAINKYPKCNAVLARRHGLFVWGDSWEEAKILIENYDYLLDSAVKMKQILGIDPSVPPPTKKIPDEEKKENDPPKNDSNGENNKKYHGAILVSDSKDDNAGFELVAKNTEDDVAKNDEDDGAKNVEVTKDSDDGFRGMSQAINQKDVSSNAIPLLPRNSKILLLDIEGCTTSIAFVKDILFPYVTANIESYLVNIQLEELITIKSNLVKDIKKLPDSHSCRSLIINNNQDYKDTLLRSDILKIVNQMVKLDIKATGLKSLQGKMWKSGYENGTLQGHVYSDFIHVLNWCELQSIDVYIYSSGSVDAQKLLFGNSTEGNLLKYLKGYFDTKNAGGKKEFASYNKIASMIGVSPSEITFISDAEAELVAAKEAGIGNVIMSIRPGNAPLTSVADNFPSIYSLLQVCGV